MDRNFIIRARFTGTIRMTAETCEATSVLCPVGKMTGSRESVERHALTLATPAAPANAVAGWSSVQFAGWDVCRDRD